MNCPFGNPLEGGYCNVDTCGASVNFADVIGGDKQLRYICHEQAKVHIARQQVLATIEAGRRNYTQKDVDEAYRKGLEAANSIPF